MKIHDSKPLDKTAWLQTEAHFLPKELEIKGFQVMQRWEDNYMKSLASVVVSKGGNVLEVGFGLGMAARFIQRSKKVKTHTVLECHPQVIKYAKKMFPKPIVSGRLILIEGFWEDTSSKLKDESFDGIFFDSSPLDEETHFFQFFPFFKEAHRLLKPGGIFTYFSDEATGFSEEHMRTLLRAGFEKKNIDFKICRIKPPKSCRYWRKNTIIVPIVIK